MKGKEVNSKLCQIIRSVDCRLEEVCISEETSLINDLMFDSIEIILLITQIEQQFNVLIDLSCIKISQLDKVSSLEKYILERNSYEV